MKIKWIRCQSYKEARDYSRIIYLHEGGIPPSSSGVSGSYFAKLLLFLADSLDGEAVAWGGLGKIGHTFRFYSSL